MSTVRACGIQPHPRFPSSVCRYAVTTCGWLLTLRTGLYLTDITFCREGNPSLRTTPKAPENKLINFNKYHKLARIVQGMVFIAPPINFLAYNICF